MRPLANAFVLSLAVLGCARAEPAGTAREPAPPSPPIEPPAAPAPEPREVRFATSDGVTIAGTLRAAPSPHAPLVILVHQLASDRSEWSELEARLAQPPVVATLAIDLRGHGASTEGTTSWREYDAAAWARTGDDVAAALAFVRSEASGVSPARVGLVGSSIGSTAVILAAAREGSAVGPVVALSPGRAYRGVDAITPSLQLAGHDFLAVVAREEPDSVETASAMARITSTEPLVVAGSAHGVALFREHPEALDRVEAMLRRSLGAEAPR